MATGLPARSLYRTLLRDVRHCAGRWPQQLADVLELTRPLIIPNDANATASSTTPIFERAYPPCMQLPRAFASQPSKRRELFYAPLSPAVPREPAAGAVAANTLLSLSERQRVLCQRATRLVRSAFRNTASAAAGGSQMGEYFWAIKRLEDIRHSRVASAAAAPFVSAVDDGPSLLQHGTFPFSSIFEGVSTTLPMPLPTHSSTCIDLPAVSVRLTIDHILVGKLRCRPSAHREEAGVERDDGAGAAMSLTSSRSASPSARWHLRLSIGNDAPLSDLHVLNTHLYVYEASSKLLTEIVGAVPLSRRPITGTTRVKGVSAPAERMLLSLPAMAALTNSASPRFCIRGVLYCARSDSAMDSPTRRGTLPASPDFAIDVSDTIIVPFGPIELYPSATEWAEEQTAPVMAPRPPSPSV